MADLRDQAGTIIPALYYEDATAALAWLESAFGFEVRLLITDDDGKVAHSEMSGRQWPNYGRAGRLVGLGQEPQIARRGEFGEPSYQC